MDDGPLKTTVPGPTFVKAEGPLMTPAIVSFEVPSAPIDVSVSRTTGPAQVLLPLTFSRAPLGEVCGPPLPFKWAVVPVTVMLLASCNAARLATVTVPDVP